MPSLVTSPVVSVAGKITRSGLETRTSRPSASTVTAFAAMGEGWRAARREVEWRGDRPARFARGSLPWLTEMKKGTPFIRCPRT